MFSFPGPVLDPLEWACPEDLGLSSIPVDWCWSVSTCPCTNGILLPCRIVAPPIKLQTTLSQQAPYIGQLKGWLIRRFWVTILDPSLIPPQPASDLIGFSASYKEEAKLLQHIALSCVLTKKYHFLRSSKLELIENLFFPLVLSFHCQLL